MSPRTPFIYPPAAGAPAIEWTQLRLADGAAPVDPGDMLRVPIAESGGLWEVDLLNDSGTTTAFINTGDVVSVDFGALTDLSFPTGPAVTMVVQFYDVEFISRNWVSPTVTLNMAATPPESGNFSACGAGFRLSSGGTSVVTNPRVWPAAITGTTGATANNSPAAANALEAQGHVSAHLPTGWGGAWAVNDTARAGVGLATNVERARLILLMGGAEAAFNTESAKFRFRCRYAVLPPPLEDFPA